MNRQIFENLKKNNAELLKILNIIANFGITHLEDINKIYQNEKYENATFLRSFEQWNKLGYYIKTGQKGIRIYKNSNEQAVYFDVSQVEPNKHTEQKELKVATIKVPEQLYYSNSSINLVNKYETYLNNNIQSTFNDYEKKYIKDMVDYCVWKNFNTLDEIGKRNPATLNVLDDMIINDHKDLKIDLYNNYDYFIRIMQEIAILSHNSIIKILEFAKEEDKYLAKPLDKTNSLTNNIDNDNITQNERKDGVNYEHKERNEEKSRQDELRQNTRNEKDNGTTDLRRNTEIMENGRWEQYVGLQNENSQEIHRNDKRVLQDNSFSRGNQQKNDNISRGSLGNRGVSREGYDTNESRPLGTGNTIQQETNTFGRRNQSRFNEMSLFDFIENETGKKENKQYNERARQRNEQSVKTGLTKTSEQVENVTHIPDEIQMGNNIEANTQSERNDRRTIIDTISNEHKRESNESERIKHVSEGRLDVRNTDEQSSINNNKYNEPVENSTGFFFSANKTELIEKDYVNENIEDNNSFNLKEKFNNNINAIKTLKTIENEKREATKEEQKILAKYVGWGGLANYCFDKDRASEENYNLVKELLNEKEYDSARKSVSSAYYTPNYVIKEIYNKLDEIGFKGGNILEPSCGIGNFFANMPKEMKENSNITGIELDSISARISKYLYPSINIKNEGFQDEKINNNNKYNLIIGNVPFGDMTIYDPVYNKNKLKIHDYFINKSLNMLADGGICAIITSPGTLDKKDDKARMLFAEQANFIGAVRLPSGTFGDTKTASDVLFFQKNENNALKMDQDFIKSDVYYNKANDKLSINRIYYNTETKEDINFEWGNLGNYISRNCFNDLFVGQKLLNKQEIEENDIYSYQYINKSKIEQINLEYNKWVSEGKKEKDKPYINVIKDYLIVDNIYDIESDNLKEKQVYSITNKNGSIIKINNPETKEGIYNDIKENEININSYFKNNSEKIIGTLQGDTGERGRRIIINKENDIDYIKYELKNQLKSIKCQYFEQEQENELERDEKKYIVPGNDEWEDNKVFDKKRYSHFLIGNKICYRENNQAYYVSGLKSKETDMLSYLIRIKEATHSILQNEVNDNINEANEKRKELKMVYDEFYAKYKLRINSKEIKKLIEEDDDKGLLLSLENGEYVQEEIYSTKKSNIKLDPEETYDTKQLNDDKTVKIYEDNKGKTHYIDDDNNEITIKYNTYFKENENIYAPIFTERVIQTTPILKNINNANDALIASLQTKGVVDIDFIKNQFNLNEETIINELKGQIYYDYQNEEWQAKDEFLSGNLKLKIKQHEKLINDYSEEINTLKDSLKISEKEGNEEKTKDLLLKISDIDNKISKINNNIEVLKASLPEKINFEDIDINLGSTWLPVKYYEKFIRDVFKLRVDNNWGLKITYRDQIKPPLYYIEGKTKTSNAETETVYGTKDKKAIEIFESAINLRPIEVTEEIRELDGTKKRIKKLDETILANEKAEKIKEAFKNWKINNLSNEEKAEIENIYNDLYNGTVSRKFDGSILTFPGMNNNIHLNDHQKNGVARMVFGGNTGLAHCVGSGKTYEIITGAMKFKQLGLANKSLIVVPKPIVEQWQKEFMTLYPNANIIAPSEKDFTRENRKKFLSKIATNNYDAIILSQEQFQKIPISKSRQEKYIKDQLNEYEEYLIKLKTETDYNNRQSNNLTIKSIVNKIKKLEEKLEKLKNDDYKDNIMDFEELGIDKLFVDEAHYYKNAYYATKLNRVAGIQSNDTRRTFDLQMKCKYMNEKTNYKGVYLATGTPLTNSIVELYTMMKYLQENKLKDVGLNNLDDFVANFCELKTKYELDSTGANYHQKTRINTFNNAPEVIRLFKENWDIINREDINLSLPKVNRKNVQLEATEVQKRLMQSFIERCEKMQPGKGGFDPKIDNMLKLTNDGKLSAIDPKLYDQNLPEEEGTKPSACVKNVIKEYYDTMDEKGTQLIICDVGVPKPGKKYDIYNFIKNKLIEQVIKKEEIAFASDFNTPELKQIMSKQMNEGKIRILIGSTDKVGTGLNVQHRMKALHHISLPWKPSDMEQREGRIIRQGNMYKEVNIYTYVAKGTFDARTFEILEGKANMINQIMHGDTKTRRYEGLDKDDSACISYDELVELSLPNSNIKRIKELEREIKTLKTEENEFNIRKRENEGKLEDIPKELEEAQNIKEKVAKDIAQIKTYNFEDKANYKFTIFGKKIGDVRIYTNKQEAQKALYNRMFNEDKNIFYNTEFTKIADFKDYTITMNYDAINKNFRMRVKSNISNYLYNMIDLSDSEIGNMTRIENYLKSFNEELLERHENKIKYIESEYENIKKALNHTFDKKEELENKIKEYNILIKENEEQKEQQKQMKHETPMLK